MRTFIVTLAALAAVHAADFEASYLYATPAKKDPGNEIDEHEATAKGTWKLTSLADKGYELSLGFSGQMNAWKFDEHQLQDVELYKLMVPVTVTCMAMEKLAIATTLSPGLHSDMQSISGEDFRLEGSMVGTWIHSPALQLILGVGYSDDFGKPQAFPIGGASWRATDALKLDLIFPAFAASYTATPTFSILASVAPSGGQWRWTFQDAAGTDVEVDAALKGYRSGLGFGWTVVPKGVLKLMAGYETGREIELRRADGSGTSASMNLTESIYGQLAFTYTY